jgi:hypothetical protein
VSSDLAIGPDAIFRLLGGNQPRQGLALAQ